MDKTLDAAGLCVDPATTTCPTACDKSTDCDTKHGEICCNGSCATSCQQECKSSADCDGQVCCLSPAEKSPFVHGIQQPGYDVPKPSGGSGSGGSASGGMPSMAGTTSSGGSGGTGVAACESCSEAVAAGDRVDTMVCGGNSRQLWDALAKCSCVDACSTDCSTFCATGKRDATCDGCIASSCQTEYVACQAD